MANTIILRGDPILKERPLKTSVDITPGMLCEPSTSYVQPHATAGKRGPRWFAVERALDGSGIDDAYDTDGETVLLASCKPGDEVYAWLETGNNVAVGDMLVSNGAGALQAVGDGVKASAEVDGAAANGGLTFQAKQYGSAGNLIQVVLNDAGTAGVTVSGTLITITPGSGANTATAVAAQVAANAGAAALILAIAEGTGAGEPGVSTGIQLSGGLDPEPVAMALEAVNNTSGSNARIKVEVQ